MVRNFVPAGNQKVSLISSPVHWNVVFFLVWPLLYLAVKLHVTYIPHSVNSHTHLLLNLYLFDVFIELFHCCNVNTPVHQAVFNLKKGFPCNHSQPFIAWERINQVTSGSWRWSLCYWLVPFYFCSSFYGFRDILSHCYYSVCALKNVV